MKAITAFLLAVLAAGFPAGADQLLAPELPSGVRIRPENRSFEVLPRIVPADRETMVEIIPLFDHVRPSPDCVYELSYTPMEGSSRDGGESLPRKMAVVPHNGRFSIPMVFEGEQEHVLVIEAVCGDKKTRIGDFRVYSAAEDLRALRPYKGDFHLHSNRSDGVESPAYVAAACRRAGLDFMALTDHRTYAASTEAIAAFAGAPIDLRLFPGEEVHTPDNPVHILSFGARAGVTDYYREDETAYRREVDALAASLPATPPGVNRFRYAASVWASEKIRSLGGLSMLCHPYWVTGNRHNVEEPLLDVFFDREVFDCLEVIGGFDWADLQAYDANTLQAARYYEERARGRRLAACGVSDSHGVEKTDGFGRYFTVCFAPTSELSDLTAAIKNLRSVAVEVPGGGLPRAFGPFRLVKFTQFLLREIFPQHDDLCYEEGRLMLRLASGDASAADRLKAVRGQTARLLAESWGEKSAR